VKKDMNDLKDVSKSLGNNIEQQKWKWYVFFNPIY
jgi:hypothetical protein